MHTARRTVLLIVLCLGAPATASVLGIAPPPPPAWHPAQELSRDEVFERRDALEERLHTQGFRTDHEELELAVLNLCTERPEDRLAALEILEGLARRVPERLDVLLWTTQAHHHAGDARGAVRVLGSARDRFDGQAAYHYALGIAHWFDARRHLGPRSIERALEELQRACAIQPGSAVHVMGLASVCLVTDRPEIALPYLPPIDEGASVSLPLLLLEAGLLSYDPETQEKAENLFGQAFRALPRDWAGVFEHGGGRLPDVPDGDVAAARSYWQRIDSDPVRRSNRHRLEFWRRHLQADALWGDPRNGTPGWDTETGDAWVRWGRPTVTREFTPEIQPIVNVSRSGGPPDADGRGMRASMRTWVWTWARGPGAFSLNFVDMSYMRDWHVAPESEEVYAGLQRDVPLRFSTPLLASPFELAVETTLFSSTRERASLVTSIAVVASESEADRRVENLGDVELAWALFDTDEERLDEGMLIADPTLDRDTLLAPLDDEDRAHGLLPARTARFGLDLEPGRYRLAVEAEDTITGARRWVDSRVVIGERTDDRPAMSELSLAASFDAYDHVADVPSAFVRFATVVVPVPERVVPRTQDRLFVYFEVYDLGLDDDQRTRFTVSYRVTPVGTPDGIPRIDEFVEERTGRSPEGTVVKGTAIDLHRLDPGAHELVVTVVDRVRDVTIERAVEFVVEDPREQP